MVLILLHFFCATTYIYLAVYILARRPRTALQWSCAALFLCFALWSGSLVVAHDPGVTGETARLAYDVGVLAWGSFASFSLLFITVFLGRERLLRARPYWVALGLPPLVTIWAQWSGRLDAGCVERSWGWAFVWAPSGWTLAYWAYYGLFMVGGLALLLAATRGRDLSPLQRRQGRIIFVTAVVPLGLSTLTDVVAPLLGYGAVPNMAPDFTLIWAVGLAYAIVRYRMLALTPGLAADEIVGAMSDALLLLDRHDRVAYANSAAHGLLNREPGELDGASLHSALGVDDVDAGSASSAVSRRELTLPRPSGETVSVILSTTALRGRAGERLGTVCLATDVTDLKRAEAALRQARDGLERRVAERTEALEVEMNERQQLQLRLAQSDRMASVGMLAAGVAHEINNPLTYVLFNLELVGEEAAALAAADPRLLARAHGRLVALGEAAEQAKEGAGRVAAIVKDLRTFSRVDDGMIQPVDLNAVLETAISMATNQIKYRARLVRRLGEIRPVLGHEGRLSQVILNLLINAAQAIPEGDAEHNTIRVETWHEGEEVFVAVEDSGEGIAADRLGRLFDPFFTTKKPGVGSGLGLAICQQIVSGYGGTISAESPPGRGARFTVRLAAAVAEAGDDEPPEVELADERPGVAGRILVVDDERAVRGVVRGMLGGAHEIVEADSGDRAQEVLRTDRAFDVVICDLMMPGISGMELFEWLEARDAALARRVIFISGGVFTPRARQLLSQCDNPRFEKPFDARKLIDAVDRLVATADARPAEDARP